jgi:hypothetical protein
LAEDIAVAAPVPIVASRPSVLIPIPAVRVGAGTLREGVPAARPAIHIAAPIETARSAVRLLSVEARGRVPLVAEVPLGLALRPLGALLTLGLALRPLGALLTLDALRALGALLTLRTLRPSRAALFGLRNADQARVAATCVLKTSRILDETFLPRAGLRGFRRGGNGKDKCNDQCQCRLHNDLPCGPTRFTSEVPKISPHISAKLANAPIAGAWGLQ